MKRGSRICAALGLAVCMFLPGALAAGNAPPQFTSTPPTDGQVGKLYIYHVSATDPENDTLTYYLNYKPDDMAIDFSSGVLTWTPSKAGIQPITVYVTDSYNQIYQTFSVNVSPRTNTPPGFTSSPIRTAYVGQLYAYRAVAVDPDGDQVYYFLDPATLQEGLTINESSGLVSWLPTDQFVNQSVYVNIIAKDINSLSNDQPYYIDVKRQVQAENHPPGVNGTPILEVTIGSTYTYKINGTDIDGDTLNYSLAMGPANMKINSSTGLVSWTPTADQAGTIPIKVNISDGKDTFGYVFTINVKNPVIPQHFFTDPAAPATSPEVMCLFLPAIALLLQLALVLRGIRKRAPPAAPRSPRPGTGPA